MNEILKSDSILLQIIKYYYPLYYFAFGEYQNALILLVLYMYIGSYSQLAYMLNREK